MSRTIRYPSLTVGTALAALGTLQLATASLTYAATLPIPCVGGACGPFVTSGQAGAVQAGNTLTVNQSSDRAILNWASFNISADGKVVFNQATGPGALTLNRIHDANPSQIFGSLTSNGQIYLINQNGFLFGSTATVNTGGLLASTLNMSDDVFNNGLLSALQTGATGTQYALGQNGAPATISLQPGAKLTTNAAGQRILLAASNIDNAGDISAVSGGQVVLAAGQKLYLAASSDEKLRGLLVEVNGGGTVTNTGSVTAEHGNITAVGLAINQNGRMSATTSVSENGSINLLAQDTVTLLKGDGGIWQISSTGRGGKLSLGSASLTQVNPDSASTATAVDDQVQLPSTINLVGQTIDLGSGSQVIAHGGQLNVVAATNPGQSRDSTVVDSAASIHVESGATIDLSGSVAQTYVTENLVTLDLRSNELAGSPLQRNGVLQGATVVVDARVGSTVADVSGAIGLIQRSVLERTSTGGSALFDSAGSVLVDTHAQVNVSGGAVDYAGAAMRTSQLIRADGSVVGIGTASPTDHYIGLITPAYKQVFNRWGVVQDVAAPGIGQYEAGYVQGGSAGSLQFLGHAMALSGDFLGTVTPGIYQRTAASLPLGGLFTVGIAPGSSGVSYRAPEVQLVAAPVPVSVAPGATLPSTVPLYLDTTQLTGNGFSRLNFSSDSAVTLSAGNPLNLGPGGALGLYAPSIQINSSITAGGGSITANAQTLLATAPNAGLSVASGVTLDTSGAWINDSLVPLNQDASGAALINGGSISLLQRVDGGRLLLGDNVALRADGGAWMTRAGTLTGGKGGSIALGSVAAGPLGQTSTYGANLGVEAFGVQGAQGGSFSLQAPRIQLDGGSGWLAAQSIQSAPGTSGYLHIGPALFSDFGFSSFTLTADGAPAAAGSSPPSLLVSSAANVSLATRTLLVAAGAGNQASAPSLAGLATSVLPLLFQRTPSSLTLQVMPTLGSPKNYGSLVVEKDASILADAQSSVTLTSRGNLSFDGTIAVADGSAALSVVNPPSTADQSYLPLTLSVGPDARIDVSGKAIYQPNDAQLLQGRVLDGGSVSLSAQRGSVATLAGSVIDFSGTQAPMDLATQSGVPAYERATVTSAGGTLAVTAAENLTLGGTLHGDGGRNAAGSNAGGSLSVSMTRVVPTDTKATYPTGPRTVQLVNDASSGSVDGVATLDAAAVRAAGVDSLILNADDQIAVGAGVDLTMARALTLSAPTLSVLGAGLGKLSANYITVGPQQASPVLPTASSGPGELLLQSAHIDLIGSVGLQSIGKATFASSGDLTLQGYSVYPTAPGGLLTSAGDLVLSAARIYPSTTSQYRITATGSNSTVTLLQQGAPLGTPLSVAGSLTVSAPHIVQDGTVLAPFGSLTFNATQSLTLTSRSVTSVSGSGALLPFGRVDNGTSWSYGPNPASPTAITAIPTRTISLQAPAVTTASGAVIDVSGGGDLYAYQFTPGTGGHNDVLAGGALPNTYAILPTLQQQSAPYDPMLWASSGLTPGQSIYLGAGSGVPAGTYVLLPARYALLPGAFLVSPASTGYQYLTPGQSATTVDGAPIVAGYRTFGDLANAAASYTGFEVRPGSYARTLAQYDDVLASSFFAKQAALSGVKAALPADAGALSVAVTQSLDLLATVRAKAAAGGDNASISISAPQIQVTGSVTPATTPGSVSLSASLIDSWNAGHLLLGGQRDASGAVNVVSTGINVLDGATLTADEVVLAATNHVAVNSGAKVESTSGANPGVAVDETRLSTSSALNLTGAGAATAAVLAVSDLGYQTVSRATPAAAGGASLTVSDGATVASRGAVTMDTAGALQVADGSVQAPHASWALGASHVTLGTAGVAGNGLAIDSALQGVLQQARALDIRSSSAIDIAGSSTLASGSVTPLQSLTLTATAINNLTAGSSSTVSADRIVLNGVNPTASSLASGTGSLAFNARTIALNGGELGLSGFGTVALNATGTVVGTGVSGLATTGDLAVTASALSSASGATTTLESRQGTVSLLASSAAAPSAATLASGGTLRVLGTDIVDGARLLVPSGVVSLAATHDVTLLSTATIDTGGRLPAGTQHGSNGGSIQLLAGNNVTGAAGSALSVAAGPAADAGAITVQAGAAVSLGSSLQGSADTGYQGGAFSVKAGTIAGLSALNSQLQSQGFTASRGFEVTSGDLLLSAIDAIDATHISLIADAGSVDVEGRLTARSAVQRSAIAIAAGRDIVVGAGATIDAKSADSTQYRGGAIDLATTGGHLRLAPTATVLASGLQQSGSLTLRAPATASDVQIDSVPADLTKVDALIVQPLKGYVLGATPSSGDFSAIQTSLASYVTAAKAATLSRLGLASQANVTYQPYADLVRQGALTLGDLDLSTWRFGGAPAAVAFRATQGITVNGTLSDGFTGSSADFSLDLLDSVTSGHRSSPITLVAGADLGAASAVATLQGAAADLSLGSYAVVRTGTGDLRLAAARDIVFGSGASVYTGGLQAAPLIASSTGDTHYPDRGGSIFLGAGRDIVGSLAAQSVNDWQLRSPYRTPSGTIGAYWGVNFNFFGWNVGALGGGDVTAVAGRNAIDLSAAVADSAAPGATAGSRLALGGGNLAVATGADIESGYFYVARGVGTLNALGALSASGNHPFSFAGQKLSLGTLLISGDTSYRIAAVGNVSLEGELPAFELLPTNSVDDYATDQYIYFNRYGPDSVLSVQSLGGSVSLQNRPYTFMDDTTLGQSNLLIATQATVLLSAFGGDLNASAAAMSSPSGQLSLYAQRDINAGDFALSDVPASVTSATNTANDTFFYTEYQKSAAAVLHRNDPVPASVTAGRDINSLSLELPKAVEVRAGRDIINTGLVAQNAGAFNTTLVSAGRDIRNISGASGITSASLSVGGTGQLEVLAGRNIDLEYSTGVATTGNLLNANLPSSQGANILMIAGLSAPIGVSAGNPAGTADFLTQVVAPVPANRDALVAYVDQLTGASGLSYDSASAQFNALPLIDQLPLVTRLLFSELVTTGRDANTNPALGFDRGFGALQNLFLHSNQKDPTAANPFAGNITLPYSRIYTLSGGSIALLVPGGHIDVGLATPPTGQASKLARKASELGIVAQGAGSVDIYAYGDVNVNSSRIFTLGGGDIAIWSSAGNIDAGKGAKTAISAPPPVLLIDDKGNVRISVSSAVSGSGIRTITTEGAASVGNVDLIAPAGFVNAGDAGIGSAGNLNIAAQHVVGLDNIQVGGTSTGVPAQTSSIGVSLSGATAAASATSASADASTSPQSSSEPSAALAKGALSWLDVFVLGMGEDTCRQDDVECLKRQKGP